MSEIKKEFKGPKARFGGLFRNDYKENDNHPDFKGSIALDAALIDAAEVDGVLEISAWKKEDRNGNSFLSLSIKEKYKGGKSKSSSSPAKVDLLDDDDI